MKTSTVAGFVIAIEAGLLAGLVHHAGYGLGPFVALAVGLEPISTPVWATAGKLWLDSISDLAVPDEIRVH